MTNREENFATLINGLVGAGLMSPYAAFRAGADIGWSDDYPRNEEDQEQQDALLSELAVYAKGSELVFVVYAMVQAIKDDTECEWAAERLRGAMK